jgi:3-hydroxymyristoyl/3-hydroxydecanoyl-(acyl carrier protein) dehydratase
LRRSVERSFPGDHPAAVGHFPGNPIIPGAVLLDEIVSTIAEGTGASWDRCVVRVAKFLIPVRPGDRVDIRWSMDSEGTASFGCFLLEPERLAATGAIRLEVTAR